MMRPDSLLIIIKVIADFASFLWLCAKPSSNLAAENLFLRKQLALFKERQIKPRSTDPATQITMACLSQRFDWRDALVLYAFVLIEHGSRRLILTNVIAHPTADWARQQFREAIPSDHQYRFLLHDRDCIFSTAFDKTVSNLGIKPIKSPRQSPKANAICERVIGTLRRECLDYVIALSEGHLRRTIKLWGAHYNRSRPHSALACFESAQGLVNTSGKRSETGWRFKPLDLSCG